MKVCLVSHAYLEKGYLPVLAALAAQPGVELALITPNRYKLGLRTSSGEFSNIDTTFRTYPIPIRWGSRQSTFLYDVTLLARALDEFRPEIVLHEQEVYTLGAVQLAWMTSKRSIPLVMFVWENLPRSLSWPRRRLRSYVLKLCSGLIVGSTASAKVHKGWGFNGPMEIIPQMGVSALNANPVLGLRGAGELRLAFAGRLIPEKGIDCLLRAVARLSAKRVKVRCTVAGDGPEMEKLVALCRAYNIEGLVHFAGVLQIERVAELLGRTDVLVLPSRRTNKWEEQFGRILVEAMAQATVSVGSRTGAIPEVIDSEDLIFDEDDDEKLADILVRLYTTPELFKAQQERLWMRARDLYLNEILAARKIEWMREIVQRWKRSASSCGSK
jgi:glycosyltransferase involved in cell wall biosynthesis